MKKLISIALSLVFICAFLASCKHKCNTCPTWKKKGGSHSYQHRK